MVLMRSVELPNGLTVRGSEWRREHNEPVDFGLYLYPAWKVPWPARFVEWHDYGTPADDRLAVHEILHAYRTLESGQKVEVGCAGGLGRTGTVLACFAILAGEPAESAVSWVRRMYDDGAVETMVQELWVLETFGDQRDER